MLTTRRRLEVWGDPIAHSQSPALHAAAYRVLGLDWSYGRRRVDAASFEGELAAADGIRGLSLTMPLKPAAFAAARVRDRRAERSGAVNTLLLTESGPHGFNTDIGGIAADLRAHGFDQVDRARIVGAGATATSALLALTELGAQRIEVAARRAEASERLQALGGQLGVTVRHLPLDGAAAGSVPLTLATLPGGAAVPDAVADALAAGGGLLYDVVYGHWPTALARAWTRAGAPAVAGIGMLVQQALLQVRVFRCGDVTQPLPDEAAVVAAMQAAATGV
ncbi:shikimate dehydrogenase [Microbacterium kribbense]|uniref:Shikimate dehydrogenase n=1 Tax=Microbacterium kribbense TaxID=433645 RepID=A0ABP7GRW3_9MICO